MRTESKCAPLHDIIAKGFWDSTSCVILVAQEAENSMYLQVNLFFLFFFSVMLKMHTFLKAGATTTSDTVLTAFRYNLIPMEITAVP